ncbi:hypothetical protein Prudu_019577 [Prunus dulcis]|uniref:Uncharacterized protein n=1 Tax=Prunus dulcis TaxID=3755 RepID=A0A4Y1RUP8_PRUDU|nr:hypothetical protein Prudu_019577 [Prunus dulcis]
MRSGVQNMSQTTSSVGSSKILRLFGVNLECQQQAKHESEPSTPDGSSSLSMSSSQGPTPHHHLYPELLMTMLQTRGYAAENRVGWVANKEACRQKNSPPEEKAKKKKRGSSKFGQRQGRRGTKRKVEWWWGRKDNRRDTLFASTSAAAVLQETLLRFWLEILDMVIIMEWKEGYGGGGVEVIGGWVGGDSEWVRGLRIDGCQQPASQPAQFSFQLY